METLIGFVIGYLVGTKQGKEGLEKVRESVEAIRTSPEVRQLVVTGSSIAGSAVKQVLSGGAGAILTGALDALVHKISDTETRRAA